LYVLLLIILLCCFFVLSGTSHEQDSRFKNKQEKLKKDLEFAKELDLPVCFSRFIVVMNQKIDSLFFSLFCSGQFGQGQTRDSQTLD
jgi:hypothetical protein